MRKFNVESAVEKLNIRLREAGVAVAVEIVGKKLVLRSTLPKKPEHGGNGVMRYRVSLGIPANSEGIKQAEAKSHELRRQVSSGTFDWANWQKHKPTTKTTEDIDQFLIDAAAIAKRHNTTIEAVIMARHTLAIEKHNSSESN
ncbi:Arm DNA-binding domain-containing protein [Leptolyngbya sp. AN03gr2]|uniref:Arm DNA-binding domain-containing protein n=1 Tax=unclassified Leptolyngbya TaxID=2650499 RepID=UPI003D30F164